MKRKFVIWGLIIHWKSKLCNCCIIYIYLWEAFQNFWCTNVWILITCVLTCMKFQYFDWNLIHQLLYLYFLSGLPKVEKVGLGMVILWCRANIWSYNLFVKVPLMLDDPLLVPFLYNFKLMSLYVIQNSMKITSKQSSPFRASHILKQWFLMF